MNDRNTKGQFVKGHTANVGRMLTEACKKKISIANKISVKRYYDNGGEPWNKNKKTGLVPSSAFKKGLVPWNKGIKTGIRPFLGKKRTPKTRKKIRDSLRNKYKGEYIGCKICNKRFWASPSDIKGGRKYCSSKCQYGDKESLRKQGIASTLKQLNKKGLNKLELMGSRILRNIGIEFQEQVLMFDKFLVDIVIPSKKLIIQWDGEYWHSKKENRDRDNSSDIYLRKCGYHVLRITDKEIEKDIEGVYIKIIELI